MIRQRGDTGWPSFSGGVEGGEVAWRTYGNGFRFEGGDFCDLLHLGDGSSLAVCGDVSGRGNHLAAAARIARNALRDIVRAEGGLIPTIQRLNARLIREWADRPRTTFATAAFVRTRPGPDGLYVTSASAGHPPPLVLRADGSLTPLGHPGQLLGIFPDPVVELGHTVLHRGDAVILYTDGIVDDVDPSDGSPSFADLVRGCAGARAEDIGDCVMLAVAEATTESVDNRAVLVIRAADGTQPSRVGPTGVASSADLTRALTAA